MNGAILSSLPKQDWGCSQGKWVTSYDKSTRIVFTPF